MAAGLIDIFAEEFEHLIKEFQLPLQNQILTFSLLLFIILLSPIILRRVKIPALIGLIIAGVIIGPHGFNMISETNMKEGFMGMFSKIGLLYIMFMAGLELDMHEFKRHRNRSIAFGIFTFIIPLALGYPLCKHVLGLNDMASLLTASMFSTHTLVAYPIVTKYGISKIQSVAIAIGGTILTDTAVLIILSVISGSDGGAINTNVFVQLMITLSIFSLIMFWVIPKLSRWFFSKLESEKSSQYIYVLSVLFFAAFLAEAAGIEAIIGAFVAGLVLNRLIPHSSTLMNRIEFIGSALFIPFFLIYIGMVVNLTKLAGDWWAWAIAGILTGFALISKFLAAWTTQLVFRMKSVDRKIIFGLSSAHAAATLAIIKVGFDKEILDISIVNGTVILILITSLVASFVTESASKKMLVEQAKNEPIEGPLRRSQHLLVAADELQGNEQLLDFSILITDKKVVNPISVVSVLENDQNVEDRIRKSRKYIDEFVNYFSSSEISIQATATIDHNVSNGIGRVAKEVAADIVLINDQSKTNLFKRLIGDDRDHLLDVCEKTIFFCHFERPFASHRTIALILILVSAIASISMAACPS
jgi:Kef-type K+ transport system membrane component KefB